MGNWCEEVFLSWGFGWVMSKFLPYVCMVLLVLCLFWLIRKRLKRRGIKWMVLILLLVAPSGIYFALHPIYESDLTNNGVVYQSESEAEGEKAIFVYVISCCPFCKESVGLMDRFRERNPHVTVVYVIVDGKPQDLDFYRTLSKNGIRFVIATEEELQERSELIRERYPTFMIARSGETEVWSNNDIGAAVLDSWEEEFNKK